MTIVDEERLGKFQNPAIAFAIGWKKIFGMFLVNSFIKDCTPRVPDQSSLMIVQRNRDPTSEQAFGTVTQSKMCNGLWCESSLQKVRRCRIKVF